ncbi:acyl-CoA dehydrogenase family protein [Streptomyces sp. NPDC005498]|uniref:acyl-CoA dehydrogenase family protein n=1 Tax=Streptomyces sp. NPDC005498 TaxID=3364717 RepID=UPI0036787C91
MANAVRPWMTPELTTLGERSADLLSAQTAAHGERWRKQKYLDRGFWRAAGAQRLLCRSVPAEYGGGGGTLVEDLVVLSSLVDVGIAVPTVQVQSVIAPHFLVDHGSEEHKHRWLPEMAAGRVVGALAMTEAEAGSDARALTTRAVREGDEYVITGAKTFITNGSIADLVIVAALTDPAAGRDGISLFLVDTRDCAGFTVTRVIGKVGQHEADLAELAFDGVRVPADCLLGAEGSGWGMLMRQLATERLVIAATATAAIERSVELTTRHVNERIAFGRPLIANQHIRIELAECATEAAVARAFLDSCVSRLLDGNLDDTTVAMAKWWLSDLEGRITDRCLQLFGGYGYTTDYPIATLYTNARAQRIYGGTNEIMKETVGRSLTARR